MLSEVSGPAAGAEATSMVKAGLYFLDVHCAETGNGPEGGAGQLSVLHHQLHGGQTQVRPGDDRDCSVGLQTDKEPDQQSSRPAP